MIKRKSIPKEMDYVCTPSCFIIKLKHELISKNNRTGLGVRMYIVDSGRPLFSSDFLLEKPLSSRFDYDNLLKGVLEQLFKMERDKFIQVLLKGNPHGAQFYDNIKKVQSKLGTTIYTRN